MNSSPIITILGAHGKMGSAFCQLFEQRGVEVLEVDLDTELSAREAIPRADITIFSVPISTTSQLITELAPLSKEGSLLADFTSIKSPALEAFEKAAPTSCEILGLHPMFGPSVVQDLQQQVFAATPLRSGPWSEWLLNFFREEQALIKTTTAEEHDEMMSVVQGLTHISSIATAMALKDLQFPLEESFSFASPIYRLRLEMIGRILSQSPQLYAEIAVENPLTQKSVKSYLLAVEVLWKAIKKKDQEAFEQSFSSAAEYLGDFKEEAYQRTSELIRRCKDIL